MRQTAKMVLGYNICWLSSAVSCALSRSYPHTAKFLTHRNTNRGEKTYVDEIKECLCKFSHVKL